MGYEKRFSPFHYLVSSLAIVIILACPPQFKLLIALFLHATYSTLSMLLLIRFRHAAADDASLVREPTKWIIFLIGITIPSIVVPVYLMVMPHHPIWMAILASGMAAQHISLTYHILRRYYLFYIVLPKRATKAGNQYIGMSGRIAKRRVHSGTITVHGLESYFRNRKPYLNNRFKINDLGDVFDVSRATASGFINNTYGMNFNRFINQWRLKELERISASPVNYGKNLDSFVKLAGFTDRRQYSRIANAERKANINKNI